LSAQTLERLSSLIVARKWESMATALVECAAVPAPEPCASVQGSGQEPGRYGKDAQDIRSEQAQVGSRVRVSEESGKHSEGRGLTGTIRAKWGNPEYLALDVLLEDGRTKLFWHHELEEISQ
jgi:hypothetical protein